MQLNTLLLREACQLSAKDGGICGKFSCIEDKSVLMKNKKIQGCNIQILQLLSTPPVVSQKLNALPLEW